MLASLVVPVQAEAAIVTYSDFGAWSSAVSHVYSVTIPDPGSAGFEYIGAGDTAKAYGGVTFSTSAALGNRYVFTVGPSYTFFSGSTPVLSAQIYPDDPTTFGGLTNIRITLPMPVTAFSLNFGTVDGSNVTFGLNGVSVAAGSTFDTFGPHYDTPDFIGFTDTVAFNTILLTTTDRVLNLSRINFDAPVPAIPEVQTWAMLLLGFAGMGLLHACNANAGFWRRSGSRRGRFARSV